MSAPMTEADTQRLLELESRIRTNFATFLATAEDLQEIRDSRLYRGGYVNWDDYLEAVWGLSRSRAARLIEARSVVSDLESAPVPPDTLPANEAQARPLAPLTTTDRRRAWSEAERTSQQQGEPITAATVAKAVAAVLPTSQAQRPETFARGEPDRPRPESGFRTKTAPEPPGPVSEMHWQLVYRATDATTGTTYEVVEHPQTFEVFALSQSTSAPRPPSIAEKPGLREALGAAETHRRGKLSPP